MRCRPPVRWWSNSSSPIGPSKTLNHRPSIEFRRAISFLPVRIGRLRSHQVPYMPDVQDFP